jgi:hypothetical protein
MWVSRFECSLGATETNPTHLLVLMHGSNFNSGSASVETDVVFVFPARRVRHLTVMINGLRAVTGGLGAGKSLRMERR